MVKDIIEMGDRCTPIVYNGSMLLGYSVSSDGFVWSRRLRNNKITLGCEWKRLKSIVKNSGHVVVCIRIGVDYC